MLQTETQRVKVSRVWLSSLSPGGSWVKEGSGGKAHRTDASCVWAHLCWGESPVVPSEIKFSPMDSTLQRKKTCHQIRILVPNHDLQIKVSSTCPMPVPGTALCSLQTSFPTFQPTKAFTLLFQKIFRFPCLLSPLENSSGLSTIKE